MAKVLINDLYGGNKKPLGEISPYNQALNDAPAEDVPASSGNTAANNNTSVSVTTGKTGGYITQTGNATTNESAEKRAETSLAELRDKYANTLREQYNYSADKLREERDAALRENWILQQQEEAANAEKMAAEGLSGGASETSLAALRARFQGNRNDIQSGYMDNLGELNQQQITEQADNQKEYNEKWIEYLLSLAKAEADK